jgi:hypothetical protein
VVESSNCFFDRSVAVWSVGIDQIDVVKSKTLETAVYAFDDVFSGEAVVIYWVLAVG